MRVNVLEARGLVAGYRDRAVLDGIDLALGRGERAALIGPNGSGKTTLLRALAGALRPASGTVLLEGRSLGAHAARDRARRIAVVPQSFATPFAFTAREIVALGRTPHATLFGRLAARDREAIERALRETDCLEFADRPFAELSGGERQRAVLAMALAQEADLLLLDEPTTHLDLAHQLRVLSLIRDLAESRGFAVLAALHDVVLAARHFGRLVALDGGRVVADGPPRRVLTTSLLRDVFDLDAQVTWFDGVPFVLPELVARERALG